MPRLLLRPLLRLPAAHLLLALALWLHGLPGWAGTAPALQLSGAVPALPLEPHVSWFCEPGGRLRPEQLRLQDFRPLAARTIVFGYQPNGCWFHFRLENHSDAPLPLLLELDYPVLDRVELHQPGRAAAPVITGDALPFPQRPLLTRAYTFPLQLAPGQAQDYLLRVASSSSLNVPLTLSSPEHFLARHEVEEWLNGAGFGIIAGLLLYHLFLWLAVREKVFRFYVLYVAAAFLYLLCLNGIAYRLWPQAPDWNSHAQLFFMYHMLAAAALFARDYLEGARLRPVFALALTALAGVCALLAWLQFGLPLGLGYPLQPLLTFPVVLTILAAALPQLRQSSRGVRIFLLSWALLVGVALLLALQSVGLFPTLPILVTLKGMELAFLLQQLLLALALADRLNALKREKAEKEQAILRAEAESAAKTEFLARMSHEIRTPLNALLGITQLLQETPLDKAQKNYVDTLYSSGHALLHVINDILDYSKIMAGKVELEMQDFCLLDLLDECVHIFSLKAREKSLSLVCERSRDLPVYVRGDAGRLRQILLNLLANAIKFTEHGTVHLRASVEERSDTHVRLHFEVEDTGIGIPVDKQPQLFHSFTQADSSTARQYGGSGLGLAICKQLVELMHGRIGVSSAPGQGALFRFSVLLKTASGAPAVTPAAAVPPELHFEGVRALVVEDNPINQLVINGFMHKLGVQARLASSGQEALDLLRSEPFDIVFMDCEMPLMDGFETTRRLRQWEQENGLPRHVVVALTAHALPEHRTRCLAAGMDDYLSKPLLLPRLAEKLQALLRGAGRAQGTEPLY